MKVHSSRTLACGHKGDSAHAPPNTMRAFVAAFQKGAPRIEFDVQLCGADEKGKRELVVLHDFDCHTAGKAWRVKDTPWHKLKRLDVGSVFGREFKNHRMPLLSEVLNRLARPEGQQRGDSFDNLKTDFNIEIKLEEPGANATAEQISACEKYADETARALVAMMKRYPNPERFSVSSFSPTFLKALRRHAPDIERVLLISENFPIERVEDAMEQLDAHGLNPHHRLATNANMRRWTARWKVSPWTVNDMRRAKQLAALGADSVITDHPAAVQRMFDGSRKS
jgi:glycerophosphoryl diester phosphodiesterase